MLFLVGFACSAKISIPELLNTSISSAFSNGLNVLSTVAFHQHPMQFKELETKLNQFQKVIIASLSRDYDQVTQQVSKEDAPMEVAKMMKFKWENTKNNLMDSLKQDLMNWGEKHTEALTFIQPRLDSLAEVTMPMECALSASPALEKRFALQIMTVVATVMTIIAGFLAIALGTVFITLVKIVWCIIDSFGPTSPNC